jgi:FAD/FMN-containing dehydrogenase
MNQATVFRAKKHAALETMKGALAQLSLSDALDVTSQLLADLAADNPAPVKRKAKRVPSVLQERKRGRISTIEGDSDVEAFLLSLQGKRTLDEMRDACAEKFGVDRTPSRSALHRYVQKLKYRNSGGACDCK